MSDLIEQELCSQDDLQNGQMKEISIKHNEKEFKILLIKHDNNFYAVGNKCTHYSLPLVNGVLHKNRLRCFAHGACFNIQTGDIEDYPGLDSLPTYKVIVNALSNKVILKASEKELEMKARIKEKSEADLVTVSTSCCSLTSKRAPKIVIIGAGAAAVQCFETLRQHGYTNELTVITRESVFAYDRPKLSKAIDVKIEAIELRNEAFLKESGIKIAYNENVKEIDFKNRKILSDSGNVFDYDKLLIATGLESKPYPKTKGENLNGIFTLRSYADSKRIIEFYNRVKSDRKLNIAIIGNSFIAMELASYFSSKNENIQILCRSMPFSKQLGEKVSNLIYKLHLSKGIQFHIDKNLHINEFSGEENKVKSILLENDVKFDCDLVLVAVGSIPATSFLNSNQIQLTNDKYIIVDKYLRTSIDNVYAAGDVTHFPLSCIKLFPSSNDHISIGHWQLSCDQGRCVANSLIGEFKQFSTVPFFWTVNQGKSVRLAGLNENYDDIILYTDPDGKNEFKFVCFYLLQNRVVAVSSCDWDPICSTFAELINDTIEIKREHVSNDPWGFRSLLKK